MRGIRVHITGSAASDCDAALLRASHAFVRAFSCEVIERGGGLVLGAGSEPLSSCGLPCTFDWTALEVIAALPEPAPKWPVHRPDRFVVIATQRGLEKVPNLREDAWEACRKRVDFDLETAPAGWRMGGVIRERQVLRGDVLFALSGGAGVEQLAELYAAEGKPVIPFRAELGAFSRDGKGGSRYLYERALEDPSAFFRLREGAGSGAGRLSSLLLTSTSDVAMLARRAADLITDLRPPLAFFVRLLAPDHPEFPEVERFFRDVVDSVVKERGFTAHEMGRERPEAAFMNVEIFKKLHRASLVVVDLTGSRPNCSMELGYALGRRRRVIVSAKKGTPLIFDGDKLPTHMWEDTGALDQRIAAYRDWMDRYIELPSVGD